MDSKNVRSWWTFLVICTGVESNGSTASIVGKINSGRERNSPAPGYCKYGETSRLPCHPVNFLSSFPKVESSEGFAEDCPSSILRESWTDRSSSERLGGVDTDSIVCPDVIVLAAEYLDFFELLCLLRGGTLTVLPVLICSCTCRKIADVTSPSLFDSLADAISLLTKRKFVGLFRVDAVIAKLLNVIQC